MMVSKIISYHLGQFKFIACEACYGLHELHAFATASQLPYYFYQLLLALYAHQLILTECTLLIILYTNLIFFYHLSTFVELLFIKILEFMLQLKLLLLASNIPLPNLSHIGPIPFFIFVKRIAYLIQISLHFFFIELLPISNLIQTNRLLLFKIKRKFKIINFKVLMFLKQITRNHKVNIYKYKKMNNNNCLIFKI